MKKKVVKSFTQEGVEYVIRETKNGLRCSCPDCVLRDRECKHIRKYKNEFQKGA